MMPLWFLYLAAAVLGAIVGSFLNVVILRDGRRKTILTGRSECASCKHELTWYELIPVVSFALQRGKCRACGARLSWQYPLVELLMAGLGMLAVGYGYLSEGSVVLAAGLGIAFAAFVAVAGTDIRTMEIRPEYTVIAGIAGGLGQMLSGHERWYDVVLGAAVGGGVIAFFAYGWKLLTGRMGMGEGDLWIAAAVGAMVGYPAVFPALFLAVVLGAVVGSWTAWQQKKGLQIEIPFGPFLVAGGILALLWGQQIISWYIL